MGWLINADIARKLLIDNVFLTKLRNVANTSLRTGWHPQVCEGYEISPEVYIIHRPADLGDLTVNYVNCNGKILTREQAFSIHQISKISKTSPPVNQIKLSQWNWSW
ncbi:MAG: hypothetical protein A2586_02735 [Candidatus Harrisonbacteria bacterium RIFOXYD1_FULL_40_9]|uniref:Uncharacterized protein n=1 Tax=Candidatus Harrisonbacteria bacterium RIFOXYD1_FULL_40_9 TaxID=1798412 RepID=A0A1G2A149_9BACT|nr:MAG: hypothetical protein A2586_02735 [Candidatus Harrisonbacteria bacterium RIFOXYD1_FULL_40_9]